MHSKRLKPPKQKIRFVKSNRIKNVFNHFAFKRKTYYVNANNFA